MPTPPDPDRTETYRYSEYQPDETPAEAVVTAVAEKTDRSPLEMDPLWDAIDTDALDTLCSSPEDRRSAASITFIYCGQRVTVSADWVQIAPSE